MEVTYTYINSRLRCYGERCGNKRFRQFRTQVPHTHCTWLGLKTTDWAVYTEKEVWSVCDFEGQEVWCWCLVSFPASWQLVIRSRVSMECKLRGPSNKSLLHSRAPEVSSQFPSKGLPYKQRWHSTLVVKLHMSFGRGTNTQTIGSLLSFCLFYGVCHLDFASQKTIWKSVAWNPNHFLLHLWFFRLTISIGFIWAVVRWI